MNQIETEGMTVEEATEAALRQLGRKAEEVDVEVLSEGSRGFLGLGAKPARVRAHLKEGGVLPPEAIQRASEFLVRVVKLMGMDVEVEAKHFGSELYLEVDQGAGGILIGRRGATLAALSYLMEVIVNRHEGARVKVFVDVAGYLERKRRSLVTTAQERAAEVKSSGREARCDPMGAFERKVIHSALHNDPDVRTFSEGEGEDRHVVIAPAGGEPRSREESPAPLDEPGPRRRGGDRRARGGDGDHRRGGRRRGGRRGGGRRRGGDGGNGDGPGLEGDVPPPLDDE